VVAVPPHVLKAGLDCCEGSEKPDLRPAHHGLHLQLGRHAAVPAGLRRPRLSHLEGLPAAALAFRGLFPLLPRHHQGPVWRVGPDHVGLHGGLGSDHMSDILLNGPGHRKPAGEFKARLTYLDLSLNPVRH